MNAETAADAPRTWTPDSAAWSWRPALAGALAGLLLATLGPPGIAALRELVRAASQHEVAGRPAKLWPARDLPREWRWSPPEVRVDHMFRRRG